MILFYPCHNGSYNPNIPDKYNIEAIISHIPHEVEALDVAGRRVMARPISPNFGRSSYIIKSWRVKRS